MLKRSAFLAVLVLGLALAGGRAAACPFDSDDCGTTSYAPVEPPAPADYSWVGGTSFQDAYTVTNDVWTWNNGSTWEPASNDPWPPSVPTPSLWDTIVNEIQQIFSPVIRPDFDGGDGVRG